MCANVGAWHVGNGEAAQAPSRSRKEQGTLACPFSSGASGPTRLFGMIA